MGLLDALTDPVLMAQLEERRDLVRKIADLFGTTPDEARAWLDTQDHAAFETFCEGNSFPRDALH